MSKVFIGLTEAQVRERGLDVPEYDDEEEDDTPVFMLDSTGGKCTLGDLRDYFFGLPDETIIENVFPDCFVEVRG